MNQKKRNSCQIICKISFLLLLIFTISNRVNAQSSINGVYSAIIEKSKIRLVIYEKNLEIYAKYQYFKSKKKSQPTVQKVFRGYRREGGYINLGQPHEAIIELNVNNNFVYKNFRVKAISYYDKIMPEPPNRIVNKPSVEEAPNQTLYREKTNNELLTEFKDEIEGLKERLYPSSGKPVRKITDGIMYYSHFGKDWIIYQHNGRHGKFLVEPENINPPAQCLSIYILPQQEYTIKEIKIFIENWIKDYKKLLKICYPRINKLKFYKVLNSDVGLFPFSSERQIVTAIKSEKTNNFSISITEVAKEEVTSIDEGHLKLFNEIKSYKNQYWALPRLYELKYELQNNYKSETIFYEKINRMIDSLGFEMTTLLLENSFDDLVKVSFKEKEALQRWHKTYTETFITFRKPNRTFESDKSIEAKIEKLYWSKCEKYWEQNIDEIKEKVIKCQTESELKVVKKEYVFLYAISRTYDKKGYYTDFLNSCNEKITIWRIEEEQRAKALEAERRRKMEERQRRIDSGELCACCNNERLVCERCDGRGNIYKYNFILKGMHYEYCCSGGTIQCHCCKNSYSPDVRFKFD